MNERSMCHTHRMRLLGGSDEPATSEMTRATSSDSSSSFQSAINESRTQINGNIDCFNGIDKTLDEYMKKRDVVDAEVHEMLLGIKQDIKKQVASSEKMEQKLDIITQRNQEILQRNQEICSEITGWVDKILEDIAERKKTQERMFILNICGIILSVFEVFYISANQKEELKFIDYI